MLTQAADHSFLSMERSAGGNVNDTNDANRTHHLVVSKVRHNIKTHINVILGYSELVLEEIEETQQTALTENRLPLCTIIEKTNHVTSLIEERLSSDQIEDRDPLKSMAKQATTLLNSATVPLAELCHAAKFLTLQSTGQMHGLESDLKKIRSAIDKLKASLESLGGGTDLTPKTCLELSLLSADDFENLNKHTDSVHEILNDRQSVFPSKVLIVDDNKSNLELLERKLVTLGHSIVKTDNGYDAEAALSNDLQIDIVLLDILMPGLSGYEVLERNIDKLKEQQIPVLMISSLGEQDTVCRCLELGASDYITKPINFRILSARMDSALERRALQLREKQYLNEVKIQKEISDDLLLNILPASVADRMKNQRIVIADKIEQCSVLFADLVGFTKLAGGMEAGELVQLLDGIFSSFDDICLRHGVEKIKTMGDCYMLAAGVPQADSDHAKKCVAAAMDMLQHVSRLPLVNGQALKIRIGINSGSVIAGVIGKNKFVYDMWGDTVNIAQRMESHGVAGKIQISDATKKLVDEHFVVSDPVEKDIKGRGRLITYTIGFSY